MVQVALDLVTRTLEVLGRASLPAVATRLAIALDGNLADMGSSTFLAEIVRRAVPGQWENIATEALAYLLRRPGGEDGLLSLIQPLGLPVPGGLDWVTQVRSDEDQAVPDLVGQDAGGRPVLMVEVKFWARLTAKQPNDYLARQDAAFEREPQAVHALVFLAPERRVEPLAREVAARMSAGWEWIAGVPVVVSGGGPRVVVLSWGSVLRAVERALGDRDDVVGLGAAGQLAGMCDRADREAMLPLAPEELGSDRGRRVIELCDVVDKVADRVTTLGVAAKAGNAKWSRMSYGCQLRTPTGSTFLWRVDLKKWAAHYPTPFWLRFRAASPAFKEALRRLESQGTLSVVVSDGRGKYTYVAMTTPIGVEAEELVDLMARDVARIIAVLPAGGSSDADDDDAIDDDPTDD